MNKSMSTLVSEGAVQATSDPHALLFEMIRSFSVLARTLNLSHAVKELGSTRQTVRRHISQLEEAKGEKLFEVVDRQYRLTEAGAQALPEALNLLARGRSWLRGHISHQAGMQCVKATLPEGRSFWLQQQPMGDLWTSDRPLLRECLRTWALAGGELEHEAFKHVRPYFMVFRDTVNGWICVEIGDESSYVSWSGWAVARSSIGRNMYGLPSGDEIAHLMVEPFDDAMIHQNTRLDHIFTYLRRERDGPFVPISYRRLLLAGRFPDGTFALISVVDRCKDIVIDALEPQESGSMPDELIMSMDPTRLKYEQEFIN
jgi:biotin operon repressor